MQKATHHNSTICTHTQNQYCYIAKVFIFILKILYIRIVYFPPSTTILFRRVHTHKLSVHFEKPSIIFKKEKYTKKKNNNSVWQNGFNGIHIIFHFVRERERMRWLCNLHRLWRTLIFLNMTSDMEMWLLWTDDNHFMQQQQQNE